MRNSFGVGLTTLLTGAALTMGANALLDKSTSSGGDEHTSASEISAPKATFKILNDAVECSDYGSHQCTVPVMVSAAAEDEPPEFAVVLVFKGKQVPVESVTPTFPQGPARCLPAGSVTPVILTIKTSEPITDYVPAAGYLGVATGAKFQGVLKKFRLGAPSGGYWQSAVVLWPGALALFVTAVAAFMVWRKGGLRGRMGSPSWRASDSWSANITVGASFVNALMTAGLTADQLHYMSRTAYSIVIVLFSSLLVLAPVVFGLFRKRILIAGSRNPNPLLPDRPVVEPFEGYVATFLVAGLLTLWASLGQLATFGLLIYELRQTDGLSEPVARLVSMLVAAVSAGISVYAGYGMVTTARLAPPEPADVKPKPPDNAGAREAVEAAAPRHAAADWALL